MVTISLGQAAAGDWNVRRGQVTLFSNLQLAAAIKLAREMARDEHGRLGHPVCVEMPGPTGAIVLAQYGWGDTNGAVAALAS